MDVSVVGAACSYVHFHSLDRSFRAVAAIIRVVIDVRGDAHAAIRGTGCASYTRCGLLAIIEGLDHATGIRACLWQQKVVLEYLIIVVYAAVYHFWPIALEV